MLNLPDPAAAIGAPVPLLPLEEDASSEWFVSQPSLPESAAAAPGATRSKPGLEEAKPAPVSSVQATITPSQSGSTRAPGAPSARRTPGLASAAATPVPHLPSVLAQKMASRDLRAARDALRAGAAEIPAATLSAASWNELAKAFNDDAGNAQGADRAALAELALMACKRGLEVAPEGPLAPRMWLTAARLCDERLRDRGRSNEMLAELAKRFPESPEGVFAKKRLGAPPKQKAPAQQDKPVV